MHDAVVATGVTLRLLSGMMEFGIVAGITIGSVALAALVLLVRHVEDGFVLPFAAAIVGVVIGGVGLALYETHVKNSNEAALKSYYGVSNIQSTSPGLDLPLNSSEATTEIQFIMPDGASVIGRLVIANGVARIYVGNVNTSDKGDTKPTPLEPAPATGTRAKAASGPSNGAAADSRYDYGRNGETGNDDGR